MHKWVCIYQMDSKKGKFFSQTFPTSALRSHFLANEIM